jgi:hypothetical protein
MLASSDRLVETKMTAKGKNNTLHHMPPFVDGTRSPYLQ